MVAIDPAEPHRQSAQMEQGNKPNFGLSIADIEAARTLLTGHADATPLVQSAHMSDLANQDVLLKLETMQPIGAFKLRGAMNAVMALPDTVSGVTCCSTGNHGRGVAYAAARRGIRALICVSSLVPEAKVSAIRLQGAEIRICGTSQDEALAESQRLAQEEGLIEISPFDDARVIAGQGTIGLEILDARQDVASILVPLSGGGLAGGVALAAKSRNPKVKVVGVSMDRGAAMYESIRAGHPVEVAEVESLADSLGGGIGLNNRLSFALCRDLLDDIILVSEEEIRDAMQALFFEDGLVAEGAGVVGLAALQSRKFTADGPVATIVTGRNLDMTGFLDLMNGRDTVLGDYLIKGRRYGE